jgi:hypothetical protein
MSRRAIRVQSGVDATALSADVRDPVDQRSRAEVSPSSVIKKSKKNDDRYWHSEQPE